MYKFRYLVLLFILTISCVEKELPSNLYPINNGQLWGFIDQNGNVIIEPKFKIESGQMRRLSNEILFDSLYRKVDRSNIMKVEPYKRTLYTLTTYQDKYPNCLIYRHYCNRSQVVIPGWDHKSGYFDHTGELKIPFKYDDAMAFNECLAAVKVENKYGFIDTSGVYIIPPNFDGVRFPGFIGGMAYVDKDSIEGYIDMKGDFIWQKYHNRIKRIND